MKKIILGLMVCAAPFLLAGCGSKKNVTCESNEDGVNQTVKFTYDKKKGEFTKASMSVVVNYKELDDEDQEEHYKDNVDEYCDMMEEFGYENCKAKSTSKEFSLSADIDPDTLNEQYEDKDFDEIIEEMEDDDDVKCKVR